jgi:hypothetical protein
MQSANNLTIRPITSLISQQSLPFFDDNCKCDSDVANKPVITCRYYGRNGTNQARDGTLH